MDEWTRRAFLATAGGCAAHLASWYALGGVDPLSASPSSSRRIQEFPWGRLEEVADGIWALISDPRDRTTLCNGGFIAGRDSVLMFEAFASPEGARWMMDQARERVGRSPDIAVVSHHHRDHSGGVGGVAGSSDAPSAALWTTEHTRSRIVASMEESGRGRPGDLEVLSGPARIEPSAPSVVDLGGRTVRIVPRMGHTGSDLTVEVEDPSVIFSGDLVWKGFFPNYVDAVPSRWSAAVRSLPVRTETTVVPGHGPLATRGDVQRQVAVLEEVEAGARRGWEAGVDADAAAAEFSLPTDLGTWDLFSQRYFPLAFGAWYREWEGG